MHREHHDEDIRRPHDRGPLVFTILLAALLLADLLTRLTGQDPLRWPFGFSPVWIAAILGTLRITYQVLEDLLAGRVGVNLALAQACLAAVVLREPFVAAEVVLISCVGEVLEAWTAGRAYQAIGRLFESAPQTARVRRGDDWHDLPIAEVIPGDRVLIAAGEKVPVDGLVLSGRSTVDQSTLTGEPIPADIGPGDSIYGGTLNQFGTLECQAEKVGAESTLGQVLRLVEQAQARKAPIQRAADRYARWFLPVVEAAAALTLILGWLLGWTDTWRRAVSVLVVACPCALVLATPAAVLASLAWLARRGVIVKGGRALERLASCDTLAFDKTGSLTPGQPRLGSVVVIGDGPLSESELLAGAAALEQHSRHPLARAIADAARERGIAPAQAADPQASPGLGIVGQVILSTGRTLSLAIGNRRYLESLQIESSTALDEPLAALEEAGETPVLLAVDGRLAGLFGLHDPVRPEAHDVVHELKHLGFKRIALLTGDRPAPAARAARKLHIGEVHAEQLPADKARWIEERQGEGRVVAMLGDGVNDAPALARADVGIAVGGPGSDLAAEAGDVVLLGPPLAALPDLVQMSRATVRTIRLNILGFAFGLNAVAMVAAIWGWLPPVPAAILHQFGSLLVLLNAMRLLGFESGGRLPPFTWLAKVPRLVDRFDSFLPRDTSFLTRHWRSVSALAALTTVGAWAGSGLTSMATGEIGLVRRLGEPIAILGPGLHWRWPAPLEVVTRLRPDTVESITLGGADGNGDLVRGRDESALLLMTADRQFVEVRGVLQYRLSHDPNDLRRYAYELADPRRSLRAAAEAALRTEAVRRSLDDMLTSHRQEVETQTRDRVQRRADTQGLSVVVLGVKLVEVQPPRAVLDAYRDVTRAATDRQSRRTQAQTRAIELASVAERESRTLIYHAEGRRQARVIEAGAEVESFQLRRPALSASDGLGRIELFWETLAGAWAGRPKLLLDREPTGDSRTLLLPAVGRTEAASSWWRQLVRETGGTVR